MKRQCVFNHFSVIGLGSFQGSFDITHNWLRERFVFWCISRNDLASPIDEKLLEVPCDFPLKRGLLCQILI